MTLKYISTKQERNEVDVINLTLSNLERIENEAMNMADVDKKIDILMRINKEKMELVRQLKEYETTIQEKTYQGNYSLVYFEIIQHKPFKIVTDDYKELVNSKIVKSTEDTIYYLLEFIGIIPFALRLAVYLLYGSFIILGVLLLYKVFVSLKDFLFRSKEIKKE